DPSAHDALEAFAGGPRPAFPAEIPTWVPERIADAARDWIHPKFSDDESKATIVRLTVDPRMRKVWSHLTNRDRQTGRFKHAARFGIRGVAEASKRQDFAMSMLFGMILDFVDSRPRVLFRRDLDQIQQERQAIARRLWREAHALSYLEEIGESPPGRAKILSEAGGVFYRLTTEPPIGDVVVERDRGDGEAHALALAIAEAWHWLFGAPHYTLTAIITSVALDREITARRVREWWSARPISESADKGSLFGRLSA